MTLEQSFKGWVGLKKRMNGGKKLSGKGKTINESEKSEKIQDEPGQLLADVYTLGGRGHIQSGESKVRKTSISIGEDTFC